MQVDLEDYRSQIAELRVGKRVGTSIYFHEQCLIDLPSGIASIVETAKACAVKSNFSFNVYKLDTRVPIVSLLDYPSFFDAPFPILSKSAGWDLATNTLNKREYTDKNTRPVLHRKELLLPPEHDRIEEFASLTEIAEQIGLFADSSRIGRSGFWSSLLSEKKVTLLGHTFHGSDGNPIEFLEPAQHVLRYRTALKRTRLSVPVQMLYKYDLIGPNSTFFDFGCGRGDDVRILKELGVMATGWDPHFFGQASKSPAAIVNLGYVVNVVESSQERQQIIAEAFQLADELLVVSALVGTSSYSKNVHQYKDGVITSNGTFQKYFQNEELFDLVSRSTGSIPHPVCRGVMLVFRNEDLQQKFLARRFSPRLPAHSRRIVQKLDDLNADAKSQADRYWQRCIELGRPATRSEIDECNELFKLVRSSDRVHQLIAKERTGEKFEASRHQRKQQLLVEFALSQFGQRLYFRNFPESLKRDILYHFGNYSALLAQSKKLLYSISDTAALLESCVDASDNGVGYLLHDHSLQLHISLVDKLAPILRVYVGCAGVLYGDWAQIDLVKIHIKSGKVSFMGYDDFEGRPAPELLERIKVCMWQRHVDFFDYIGEYTPTPLLMKSLFIDDTFEYFQEQTAFDQALTRTRLFDSGYENVTKAQFYTALDRAKIQIRGYDLVQVA